ncbi:hypothetical protein N7509_014001 [Penicillium cosmopolitanum]|uniref:Transcription factor domain-containing protein n=1 Tax=Penicillium cosmopolitanum TaxID=1131564 RepID=A0A9W9S1N0_9EURO|nr:uncharacterized protein N7509_014001 [Penicillium cosmopolitanum]KAJ5369389.1 hypothetical protein N7509_014001 [Penicillium cosmopolitanum]
MEVDHAVVVSFVIASVPISPAKGVAHESGNCTGGQKLMLSVVAFEQIDHLISPGAGLRRTFNTEARSEADVEDHQCFENDLGKESATVRIYESEKKISPLSLAISAILVLIPLTQETSCGPGTHRSERRSFAQRLTQAALERVEADSESLAFAVDYPPDSLDELETASRNPFHPHTPVGLESILALLILSNYEHTQRGNLLKMVTRANQALVTAKALSLHRLGPENDKYSEAKRRAWWMTYCCTHLCSIVRQSSSISIDDDSNFITPFPRLESDPEAWAIFAESLRISVASVRLMASLGASMNSQADMSSIYDQIAKLDKQIIQTATRVEAQLPMSYTEGQVQGTRAISQMFCMSTDTPSSIERQVEELRHGLEGIITTMEDFARTSEAIDDELQVSFQAAFQGDLE